MFLIFSFAIDEEKITAVGRKVKRGLRAGIGLQIKIVDQVFETAPMQQFENPMQRTR